MLKFELRIIGFRLCVKQLGSLAREKFLMALVFLPFNLRKYADGAVQIDVPGATLGEVVENLEERYPGISEHLLEDGRLKPGLAAVVGHAATRQGLLQRLEPDTEVHFVPAISGGCR